MNLHLARPEDNWDRDTKTEEAIAEQLLSLEKLDYKKLSAEWCRLYRRTPPNRVSRELLLRGIAYKIQEKAFGGLNSAMKRKLANLSENLDESGGSIRNRAAHLKPGTKLIREWYGKIHTVTTLENGFEWQGKQWRSLSVIAREITGAHWSGPRFFGLAKTSNNRLDIA